jgi:hypothetical protein
MLTVNPSTPAHRSLEEHDGKLKKIVADFSLDHGMLQEVIRL